jgi:uncharacterized protein YbjT (DUF2867 family)
LAILVTGAGGLVGQAAVAALAQQGIEHVRAVLRDPAGSGDLRRHGAKVALMDATDPDGMEAALTGVFTAVSLTGSLWAEPGGDPAAAVLEPAHVLVAAARRAGVRRLVVLSPAGVVGDAGNPWLRAKAEVEELVAGSGLEYAVLRCTHVVGRGSRLAERLRGDGVAEDALQERRDRAQKVVDAAVEAAKAAPPPDESTALTDVWADGGAQWRT